MFRGFLFCASFCLFAFEKPIQVFNKFSVNFLLICTVTSDFFSFKEISIPKDLPGTLLRRMFSCHIPLSLRHNLPSISYFIPILRSILWKLRQVKWSIPPKAMNISKCLPSTPLRRILSLFSTLSLRHNLPFTRFPALCLRFIMPKTP